ncbi:MAG: HAMP domain-containing histidine kinase [Clostridia bacterium]|nr:HAMP domain-containing histidine kinase [Clostridia bacterium]MBQ7339178.1 HAMP domain-containing histidine kinase [Clostridia bacterium]
MIKKLKRRFIVLAVCALFVLLAVIITVMNAVNYRNLIADADEILLLLSHNRGTFPGFESSAPIPMPEGTRNDAPFSDVTDTFMPSGHGFGKMSPELPYESRYFSVLLAHDGSVMHSDVSRIASVDEQTAIQYAQIVAEKDRQTGFVGSFRYTADHVEDGMQYIFLDCGRKLDVFFSFLYTSLAVAACGLLIISLVLIVVAGRIIRPIAESYEKQKRFITDAGHEIKTPLTIINTNVDILEMEFGENESLSDIHQQTNRLTNLTNQLVYLARMEEGEQTTSVPLTDFSLSELVQETSAPFHTLAASRGKTLLCEIAPSITLHGNDIAIGQLVSILLENALKYSPTGDTIRMSLSGQGRTATLTVINTSANAIDPATIDRAFDRFWRSDSSRNSDTGGHGIGLSIARAIVTAHGGKISVAPIGTSVFKITAVLPLR